MGSGVYKGRAELFESIFATAIDGIIVIDEVGVVESFNPGAERLFGYRAAEVVGQNVRMLMPSPDRERHDGYLAAYRATRQPKIIGLGREVLAQNKTGERIPIHLALSEAHVGERRIFVGICRDIRELVRTRNVNQAARHLELNDVVRGCKDIVSTLQVIIETIVRQCGAIVGAAYLESEDADDDTYVLSASSALALQHRGRRIRRGEGFVGECIASTTVKLVELGESVLVVQTAFGEVSPRLLCAVPFVHHDGVIAAAELGFIQRPDAGTMDYIKTLVGLCGMLLGASRDQLEIARLFEQARARAEELKVANQQLDQWAQELQAQQEELEASNEQLAEQKSRLEAVNEELSNSRAALTEKAHALETISRYKSEFLANMSHELRTPLNSILILAKVLSENQSKNLQADQIESLGVIASSGTDLLNLVNDILDLSKIEAGKLAFHPEEVSVAALLDDLKRQFTAMMQARNLEFVCHIEQGVPPSLWTDRLRVLQVIRNLLSNANKFTEKGSVRLTVEVALRDESGAPSHVEFAVTDTGIGIPDDKQMLIFQPFQQLDAGLSRRYGGTGLGLSISTSLAAELGGRLELSSNVGKGSVFKLVVPVRHTFGLQGGQAGALRNQPGPAAERNETAPSALAAKPQETAPSQTILIVEDDEGAQLALRRLIESRGLMVRAASSLEEAREIFKSHPIHAIVLDLGLHSGDGLEFARWLRGSSNRATPVIVHMGRESSESEQRELRELTQAVVMKGDRSYERLLDEVKLLLHSAPRREGSSPVRHRDAVFFGRHVLVVDDDLRNIFALRALLTGSGMTVHVAEDGNEALQVYNQVSGIDCIIMDLMMPGMDGLEAMRQLRKLPGGNEVPIIALTAKAMKEDRQACFDAGASDYMSKPVNNDELLGLMRVWMTR